MTAQLTEIKEDAYEIYGTLTRGPLLLTCEHASNRVPPPMRVNSLDKAWLNTHWGWDIGARTVTRELVRMTGSTAVLARYSRLVCDPNRDPRRRDFVRTETEGARLTFNQNLNQADLDYRVERFYKPYHDAIDRVIAQRLDHTGDVLLLSVHSFTPVWNGRARGMEVGVLYNPYQAVAERLKMELDAEGFFAALNEPYSAQDGLMHSMDMHGQAHELVYLEIELNQSLVNTPYRARKCALRIGRALQRLKVRQTKRG